MPAGWSFNAEAFLDGAQFGVYAALLALALLITITAVRRVLSI
jgi:hypothetical protein